MIALAMVSGLLYFAEIMKDTILQRQLLFIERMPMIRLIATDIDGTLVEEAAMNLNPEYFDVIREFRKRGVLFVAASGRQRNSIERFFEPIKDDIIFLSENGACITSREYKHVDVMDPFIVKSIMEDAMEIPGCTCALNDGETSYFDSEMLYRHMKDDYGYNAVMVDDVFKVEAGVCKVSVFHNRNAEDAVGKDFYDKWGGRIYVASAGEKWVDCMNLGVNKGNSLKRFQEHYNISADETLAFGDNINDIEMLKRAAHSFAVANAREEVKEAANFVTDSNREDGVLKVLKAVLRGELC